MRQLREKLQAVESAANSTSARNDARNDATKETLARIDSQLSRLIETILHRA